jgi:hypothetical protein
MISHTCELPAGHDGPHSNPSDMTSVDARKAWQAKEREREAERRHQESGLSMTQSRPLTSASIVEPGSQRPHPGSSTDCIFCDEKPLVKNFAAHIAEHAREIEDPHYAERKEAHSRVAGAIPQPPETFRVIRDPHAAEEPLQEPYLDEPQASEGEPDAELHEAVAFLDKWFEAESRPRMVTAAWSVVRERARR